ncbi:MAG: MFS transporter, partial [Acidobacteria bacterium]|nr:MFS transporter [Acidobacteriota bacterium]
VGGHLADRVVKARTNGRLLLGSLALFSAIPLKLVALGQPLGHPYLFLSWMLPGCLLMYVYYSTVYSTIQDIVEPSLRGTAMAIYFFAMYALGGAVGPVVTGAISDSLARQAAAGGPITEAVKAAGLHQAMYVIPALEFLVGVVLYAGSRTVTRDHEKLQAWMAQTAR